MTALRAERYLDIAHFWRDAREFLERDETGNTQVMAIAARHLEDPGTAPPAGYIVYADEEPVAAALLSPKGTLLVSPSTPSELRVLRDSIADNGPEVIDISGERGTAERYAYLAGHAFRTHVVLQLYRLDQVLPVGAVNGRMRQANDTDYEMLCAWQSEFMREANVREGTDDIAQSVTRRLRKGGAWLWEVDGMPVAHAAFRLTPIRSARIAPVYTPAEHRGLGYATALVAALSRALLEQGRAPLFLFADTTNPTANGVYRRVGFRSVGEHVHLTRDNTSGPGQSGQK
ncbi:MAG: GNAT family N-acetyltransferase [Casimicrobiaceae bacterium]